MDANKWGLPWLSELILPEIDPFFYRISGISAANRLLSDAHQLQRGYMKHFLDGTCIVTSLDHIKSDTVADFNHRSCIFFERDRFTFSYRVQSIPLLKFFRKLFLHFEISLNHK